MKIQMTSSQTARLMVVDNETKLRQGCQSHVDASHQHHRSVSPRLDHLISLLRLLETFIIDFESDTSSFNEARNYSVSNSMSIKPFAVIAGVGAGTGASLARRFAKSYPVALLARTPASYDPLVEEINKSGGKAIGFSTDMANEESVKSAFARITKEFDNAPCAAAIYNASGGFVRQPFLETKIEDLEKGWSVTVYV